MDMHRHLRHSATLLALVLIAGCTASPISSSSSSSSSSFSSVESPPSSPTVVASTLSIPWSIAFLPDGDLLVTERPGTLKRIGANQGQHAINGVHHIGEGGLLGITLHPEFEENGWLYLYLTSNDGGTVHNRVERYTYQNDELTARIVILDQIPGSLFHDGGALAFGPDGLLYITTGDAQKEQNAQNTASLAGKILRVHDDGSIPNDNPFGNPVYSYGHRNPQGLAWDDDGNLWATEHGRSGVLSGFDELNRIEKGGNYGWPEIQGDETREGMIAPVLHSGNSDTWAPASATYHDGSIFFGGLRGEALYEVELNGTPALKTHLKGTYGRIRAVTVNLDGTLLMTTSNTDGRGSPESSDDRIIRVDPATLD
ncbi:hypothetical protein A2881_04485 [Candidatus Peribacteria bacterium RIFCSPHIGHO2_01_FULL_55_13]|nr:MAG: hypothetical protein A2881_04485 [Candidatus Peribacteria bacterium RIFCSPHIGHO2_01_FULL_55_13]